MDSPNIPAAIGHALHVPCDLLGRDKVLGFFREEVGKIVKNRFPIDAGGIIGAKCQDDFAELINNLLDQSQEH